MSFLNDINNSPDGHDQVMVVARDVGQDLVARLDLMTITPTTILVVGSDEGVVSECLKQRFKQAKVFTSGAVNHLAQYAKPHSELPVKQSFENQSIDLIVANLSLSWHKNALELMREWLGVLTPNGLLMLTALGIDTLQEYRAYFSNDTMPTLYDMHDIGDALVEAGFLDPVLDVSHLTLSYDDPKRLVEELIGISANKHELVSHLTPSEEGDFKVTYEVVSAHAFAPAAQRVKRESDGSVSIPISQIKRRPL